MAEKTTVAFRVDESVKKEWEEASESSEYDSLSHLIRLAVQREITNNEPAHREDNTESNGDSEMLQSLNRIETTVTDMQDEMDAIGRESRSRELYDLEQVLLEIMPTFPEPLDQDVGLTPGDVESETSTPRDLAEKIGADTSDVTDALERLEENVAQVKSVTHKRTGDTRYWRLE